jgi:NADPH:quinone reductase-like Zn-dependent oxidoreductase
MKAVVLKAYGGADQLFYEEVETPRPGGGEVLVKLAATSVNPIDWKLRSGMRSLGVPLAAPLILGRDLAGEVVELGAEVTGLTVGQRVMALADHTYAEFATLKADALSPIPDGLGFEAAAALPLVSLTGSQLIERGIQAKAGQAVLITGPLGGVGRVAVYVASQHRAQVIAAVRPSQLKDAEGLGTLAVVSLEDEEGLARFPDLDGLADTVGGAVAVKLLKLLRHGGVYASVVGVPEEAKQYEIHTESVRAQSDPARLTELAVAVASGRFEVPVAKVMKLAEIREAHRLAEAGGLGGKIVLVP